MGFLNVAAAAAGKADVQEITVQRFNDRNTRQKITNKP